MSDATNPSAVTPEELARARKWYAKWLRVAPHCAETCDGDLIGVEHEPDCPCFRKEEPTTADLLALYARQEREAERERIETLESLLADAIEDLENGWTPRGGLIHSAKKQLADRMEAKK